jgi:LmbE family N-acetylglucosaminyl deacetylase
MSQPLEHQWVPYEAVRSLGSGPILVFAPHPDDETLGCGGAIMRHLAAGDTAKVVIVTDGAFGSPECHADYQQTRRTETQAAAQILGYGEPVFWDLPDRGLVYEEALIERIRHAVELSPANLVYAPSWWEIHPDHSTLSLCVAEAIRRCTRQVSLLMYEVGAPLQPNRLLDITEVNDRKQAAIRCFASQLVNQAYDQHIGALNRFRTYTLPKSVQFAEAYRFVTGADLKSGATFERLRNLLGLQLALFKQLQRTHAMLMGEVEHSLDAWDLVAAMDPGRQLGSPCQDSQIQKLRDELDELYRSTSWRITAPLRTLARLFRGSMR